MVCIYDLKFSFSIVFPHMYDYSELAAISHKTQGLVCSNKKISSFHGHSIPVVDLYSKGNF